jgi:hypothetical protein
MNWRFSVGNRYRLTILPAGARTKTITVEGNYLGRSFTPHAHDFDCRPEMGTQAISDESIQEVEKIGPAVYAR